MTNRRATRPLDPDATAAANEAVWQEMDRRGEPRRQLTMGSDDYEYRRMWMDAYVAAGGAIEDPATGTPPSNPAQPCQPGGCVLEITDDTGTVLTGTVTKIVGQKIKLRVRTNPPGQAMTNISWTIPAEVVKDYTVSAAAGTKTDLSPADLQDAGPVQNHAVDFYWINGGNKAVQVSAEVGGCTLTQSVTFDVKAPTAVSMTSATGAVAVGNPGFLGAGLELHFGTTTTPGIRWTCTATAPAGGAGEIAGTQLINTFNRRTQNNGATQQFSSGGNLVLDNTVPYATAVAIPAGAGATWTSDDSPGTPLTAGLSAMRRNDSFEMYFVYKPAGADSIWVTIAKLDWNWAGRTTRVGAPAGAGNNWNPPTNVASAPNPVGVASTTLPTWTSNFTGIAWV